MPPCTIIVDGEEARRRAHLEIEAGGVVAFRTDTFYGLGADPFNPSALARVNQLKGREGGKPILLVISETEEAERFIERRTKIFDALAKDFWPGPLTIVARARAEVPVEITAGTGTVGVRLPLDEDVRAFIRACGGALTATSANPAGLPPARTAVEVADYFRHGVDLIVDGGPARTDKPSTVVDARTTGARLIREGEISRDHLQRTLRALGEELED